MAALMAAAVALAALVASAAAQQAEVRWEVGYLTLEPLGPSQKASTCCSCHLIPLSSFSFCRA
jgi:hypothetical protein